MRKQYIFIRMHDFAVAIPAVAERIGSSGSFRWRTTLGIFLPSEEGIKFWLSKDSLTEKIRKEKDERENRVYRNYAFQSSGRYD